jgi:formate dehydrogenase iron-sulfur subunit
MVEYGLLIDTSLCVACRACQVSCKQWNEREAEDTINEGSYENPRDLSYKTWTYVRFHEYAETGGEVKWLFRRELCRHCEDPGCLAACPVPNAIVKDSGGMVIINRNLCGDCNRECWYGCPWGIPRFIDDNNEAWKCWMCRDRVFAGLATACSKTCPTGATQTLEKSTLMAKAYERLAIVKLKHPNANIYPPTGYGTNVVWILEEDPSHYDFDFPTTSVAAKPASRPMERANFLSDAATPALAVTALTAGIAVAAKFLKRRDKVRESEEA